MDTSTITITITGMPEMVTDEMFESLRHHTLKGIRELLEVDDFYNTEWNCVIHVSKDH